LGGRQRRVDAQQRGGSGRSIGSRSVRPPATEENGDDGDDSGRPATFPGEIWAAPRSWVETVYPGLAYFNEVDRGGHFAAWEEPELFSEEIRAAFKPLR
jgi:hypothetical protein